MNDKRVFFDTNVLVYAHDKSDPQKQSTAIQLIRQHLTDGSGVISSQVVQEFCNVALKKFRVPLAGSELESLLQTLMGQLWSQVPSIDFYTRAIKLHTAHSLSFYDACIVQAAADLNCETLYTEDLQDGQCFGQLTIVDPFKIRQ